MVHSGRGIVLGFIKYGDSSVIARIFTEDHGLIAFLIQGVFRKKARISSSMLQAFSLLDMVYYFKENRQIQKVKELRATPSVNVLQSDVVKSSLALFACEVLQKTLNNTEKDKALFSLVYNSVIELCQAEKASSLWPHYFLLAIAQVQGFAPSYKDSGRYFHLKEGVFTNIPLGERETTNAQETQLLLAILNQAELPNHTRILRNNLLDKLISFFAFQTTGFKELKSLPVIRDVLK